MSTQQSSALEEARRQLLAALQGIVEKYSQGEPPKIGQSALFQANLYRRAYHRGYDTNSVYSQIYGSKLENIGTMLPAIINEIVPGRSKLIVEVNGFILLEAGNLAPRECYLRKTHEEAKLYTENVPTDEQEVRLGGALKASYIRALGHYEARTDSLTGLNNQRVYNEEIETEIFRADRYGKALSVAVIDVDNFKLINDTYGHPGGDEVLRAIARLLLEKSRKTDTVARYGGDELVLLLPETPKREAIIHAINVRKAIQSLEVMIKEEVASPTVTIGVATYPSDADNAKDLYSRADEALLEAKAKGRNRVKGAPSLKLPREVGVASG
jgi:diguanylate cyclase (GGDEF)-like protein